MKLIITHVWVVIVLLLACINTYDPFKDPSNAGLDITYMSFKDQDTLAIFQRETLSTITTVKDLLDSFTVQCTKNRLWKDTSVKAPELNLHYEFHFSFYDTGTQVITITAYPRGAKFQTQIIELFTQSNLDTDTLKGGIYEPVILKATPVVDEDVFYNWDLGDNIERFSVRPEKLCTLSTTPVVSTGWVWISDQYRIYDSPKKPFSLILKDTKAPLIFCENTIKTNDTIITGDSLFFIRLRIYDIDNYGIADSVSVNGYPFDAFDKPAKLYMHAFENMQAYTHSNPRVVNIFARDIFENDTTRTFYLYFDPTLNKTAGSQMIIYNISGESEITFSDTLFPVMGRIESAVKQKLTLKASVNSVYNPVEYTIPDGDGQWKWLFFLSSKSLNTIRIEAYDSLNTIVIAESLIVYHTEMFDDKEQPVIIDIRVNDSTETAHDTFYTEQTSATIMVVGYDKNSLISKVSISDIPAVPSDNNLVWTVDSLNLLHKKGGNSIPISLTDKSGNVKKDTITVIQNKPPYLQLLTDKPEIVNLHTVYTFSYALKDNDAHDELAIQLVNHIDSLIIDSGTNTIYWKPQESSLGAQSISFSITDGYTNGLTYLTWQFQVLENPFPPVQFETTSDDLADTLLYEKDSLKVCFGITEDKGVKPFLFSMLHINSAVFIAQNSLDSIFTWIPSYSDIGINHFQFQVSDSVGSIDTFYHTLTVTAENKYPCSLSVSNKNIAIGNTDTVFLQTINDTAILNCIIWDNDHPSTELYTVTYTLNDLTVNHVTNDTVFYITVLPIIDNAVDSLLVNVLDMTGQLVTFTIYIKHPSALYRLRTGKKHRNK